MPHISGISASKLAESMYGPDELDDEYLSDEEDTVYEDNYYSDDDEWQNLEAVAEESDEIKEEKPEPKRAQLKLADRNSNECSICMETEEELIRIKSCLHTFCKACLTNYISFKTSDASCIYHHVTLIRKMKAGISMHIEDVKVYGVLCPSLGCKHVMMVDELIPLATSQAVDQFQRFSTVHAENLARIEELRKEQSKKREHICTSCGTLNIITKKGHRGKVKCKNCSKPFCSTCGHNHSIGVSCTAWIEAIGKGLVEAMELMRKFGLARCPRCSMFAEKISGCNFLTCRCNQNFCFLCSAALDQTKHFTHFHNAPYGTTCLGLKDSLKVVKK